MLSGFIGLGNMVAPMAHNAGAGHNSGVFDLSQAAVTGWSVRGQSSSIEGSPTAICELMFSMLCGSQHVKRYLG